MSMRLEIDLSKSSDVDMLFKSSELPMDKYANSSIDDDYAVDAESNTEMKFIIDELRSRIITMETIECIDSEILMVYCAKISQIQKSLENRRTEIRIIRDQLDLLTSRI